MSKSTTARKARKLSAVPASRKLIVAFCDGGSVHGDFAMSMLAFQGHDHCHRNALVGTLRHPGLYIDDNRNAVTEKFVELSRQHGAEWMLMLDSDMSFAEQPDLPYRLLDAADPVKRPILSALYFGYIKSNLANGFNAIWMKKHHDGYRTLMDYDLNLKQELTELDAVGMGCCLIHRSVFEKMAEAPDFRRLQWFGREIIDHDNGVIGRYGEDVAFCRRAQMAGFKIYGHGGITLDHVKSRKENAQTFLERLQIQAIEDKGKLAAAG